ncbi:MRH4 [Candida margitis]|uniref:MRH4 n=1 Tax=Candida margitis TaxID=1775924 RepID=UPI002226E642|nr:MRH4 [Candida margitis]KAI5968098.1 MRH4 [Candida margitis]
MFRRLIRHGLLSLNTINGSTHLQLRCLSRYSSKVGPSQKQSLKTKQKIRKQAKEEAVDVVSKSKRGLVFESGKFSQLHNDLKTSIDTAESKIDTFDQLKIFPSVRQAMIKEIKSQYNLKGPQYSSLDEIKIKPTPVQISAIRKINQTRKSNRDLEAMDEGERIFYELKHENELKKTKIFTVAAETGSGKTWSYLSPLLSKLKEDDFNWFNDNQKKYELFKKSEQVRSIILVPTHELVEQVYDVLNRANKYTLDHENVPRQYKAFLDLPENSTLGLSIMKLSHGDPPISLYKQLRNFGKVDVLVTTPAKVTGFSKLEAIDRPFKIFKSVRYCVLDEADTLFDPSFLKDTTAVVKSFPQLLDLILVSATIPKEFERTLARYFPDEKSMIRVSTPSLHKVPRNIKVMTLDADLPPYNGSKPRCLAQAIYAVSRDGTEPDHVKRIIVFVNEKSEVEGLVDLMISKYGIRQQDIFGISGKVKVQDRKEFLEPFLAPAQLIKQDVDGSKVKILVTTDLLARGLNFIGIKNVILMGLPRSSVDLVHRLGRTGRMNQSGRVFIIADKKSKKSWVKGLGNAIIRGVKIG